MYKITATEAIEVQQKFLRLLSLQKKAEEKFLQANERFELRRLIEELKSFFANLEKGN